MSLDLFFPVRQIDDTTIVTGDCRDVLKMMESQSVQCCVTSPPFFGLRDYGHADQIGLEKTPDEYVAQMVAVFREVQRVLRDDGVLWLNLGDSYAANRTYQVPSTKGGPKHSDSQSCGGKGSSVPYGLKPKDLIGIPWRVAFALQADGWYLRQDIIWHKPNPMPESVTDRCTKAHEYIFMLTKSQRYFYDADAVKEPVESVQPPRRFGRKEYEDAQQEGGHKAVRAIAIEQGQGTDSSMGNHYGRVFGGETQRNKRSVWKVATSPYKGAHFATFPPSLIEPCVLAGSRPGDMVLDPFGGSGTTAQVAAQNSRKSLVIELNPNYINLCEQRVANTITPKDHLTMLTLTNVQDALGLKIPADFITNELKITPAKTDKRAVFFEPAQLATICDALIQHIHGVKTGTKTMVAKPKKDKAPSLDDLF